MAVNKQEYTFELNDRQHQFLGRMVEKWSLPDEGKAIRCLIDYAMHESDEEQRIFEPIRCSGC
jgi:hypothetical protein